MKHRDKNIFNNKKRRKGSPLKQSSLLKPIEVIKEKAEDESDEDFNKNKNTESLSTNLDSKQDDKLFKK